MIIKNQELKKIIKENGSQYALTMYVNRFFDMTNKQLDYVLKCKEKENAKRKKNETFG